MKRRLILLPIKILSHTMKRWVIEVQVQRKDRPGVFPERCMIQLWNDKCSIQKICSHDSINYLQPQAPSSGSIQYILKSLVKLGIPNKTRSSNHSWSCNTIGCMQKEVNRIHFPLWIFIWFKGVHEVILRQP